MFTSLGSLSILCHVSSSLHARLARVWEGELLSPAEKRMETFPSANEMMCIILCLPSNRPTQQCSLAIYPTSEAARQSINLVLLWITLTLSVFIFQVSSCGRLIYLSVAAEWITAQGKEGQVRRRRAEAIRCSAWGPFVIQCRPLAAKHERTQNCSYS